MLEYSIYVFPVIEGKWTSPSEVEKPVFDAAESCVTVGSCPSITEPATLVSAVQQY